MANWVESTDTMRHGGEDDQRANGEELHDSQSYDSLICALGEIMGV